MLKENSIDNSSLMQILNEIYEFRDPNRIEYTLPQILLLVIIASNAGIKDIYHIGEFAKAHQKWFKEKLDFIECHHTIQLEE